MTDKLAAAVRGYTKERRRTDERARVMGARMADELIATDKQDRASTALGLACLLDRLAETDVDDDCAKLTVEWTFEYYWAMQVERHLKLYRETWAKLVAMGAEYDDRLVWGDLDCGAWVEPHDELKIVCLEVYCACRDDNTYVYVLSQAGDVHTCFHARTCWPREVRSRYWEDRDDENWRGVDKPSVHTYRRFDWTLGYADCRDKGYCFTYDTAGSQPKVDSGYAYGEATYWALWHLRSIAAGIEHPLEVPTKLRKGPRYGGMGIRGLKR